MSAAQIPVHILTGFLGTGKTTLLNRLLKLPQFADTLVIINEFGEVSLDHHLVESSTETIFELSNGCLCCNMRGELVETLGQLDTNRFQRIIIETTGIANPLPVFQSLYLEEGRGFRPGGILTVLNANSGSGHLENHPEARQQLALADVVFTSHCDAENSLKEAVSLVRSLNTNAVIIADPEEIELDDIFPTADTKTTDIIGTNHTDRFHSIVLESDVAKPVPTLVGFLTFLANQLGENLLRVKGFARHEGGDGPLLLQMSGPVVHDPILLQDWPTGEKKTRLVVIIKDTNPQSVRSLFDSFFDVPRSDNPDRQALTENPLSILGT